MASTAFPLADVGPANGGNLQRQGSLTLPRTLSQKTVDEVWRDLFRESGGRDGNSSNGAPVLPQRQQTLGEMTLEEFLVRAGVVREDNTQLGAGGVVREGTQFYGDFGRLNNSPGLDLRFSQAGQSNWLAENSNSVANQVNGFRSPQQNSLFPKQAAAVGYAAPMQFPNNAELANTEMRNGIVAIGDQMVNNGLVGFGGATGSPANQVSSDGVGKSNGDTSSLSPAPYAFNGSLSGRKRNGTVEKVVERRQRRMIKNRESAARSRARKQAYTMELEAEVAKLKEENEELQKKQAQIMEMQKNQVQEMMNLQCGRKKRCLRRTQTGPW
eukprot:TRINITY_DN20332_c0_g1_i1.p1 TRINITY_DN20332_c0_g1~~TRINITY_DN20332_c0_g1_i1.p1  ORF type:complete len:376 (+),score=67.05 TRINITY_DN20332_c0_g1_i1:150-1130(+)